MQATYPAYEEYNCAKSFFFRAINRFKTVIEQPHLEPHRDRRGENRRRTKCEYPVIVQLIDELLSEPKANPPKVKAGLRRNGFSVRYLYQR